MNRIRKERPPPSLVEYVKTRPNGGFIGLDTVTRQAMVVALRSEQRSLCCYCMRRVPATVDSSKSPGYKIEHYSSQSAHPELELDWNNLLLSCPGGDAGDGPRTCDSAKANKALTIDPRSEQVAQLRYEPAGRIRAENPDLQRDLDETLNLNHPLLVSNRKAVLRALIDALTKQWGENGRWSAERCEQRALGIEAQPRLPEYSAVLVFWLKRRASRLRKNA